MPQRSEAGPESQPTTQVADRLAGWAWLPIPALLLAMAALRLADLKAPHEAPQLLPILNFAFSTAVSAFIAYLAAIAFLASGAAGLLALGCGVLVMGASFLAAGLAGHQQPNVIVTIHNLGMLASGLLHLAGVLLVRRSSSPVRRAGVALGGGYLAALAAVLLASHLARERMLPIFFVEGVGGTTLRQIVLVVAIGLFAVSGLVMVRAQPQDHFRRWYAAGLLLLAVGLVGVMLQSALGSPISWAGRGAQYLGGAYLLLAALSATSQVRRWGLPLEVALLEADARHAVLATRERTLADSLIANQRLVEDLRASQRLVEAISEAIPEPVFMKDLEGRWLFANRATLQAVGRTLEQVLGRTDVEIQAAPEIARSIVATDRRIVRSGRAEAVEEIIQTPGGYRTFLSTKAPVRGADGQVVGLVGVARDITEQRRAQDALRDREHLLSESQRIAHIGTWTWDLSA